MLGSSWAAGASRTLTKVMPVLFGSTPFTRTFPGVGAANPAAGRSAMSSGCLRRLDPLDQFVLDRLLVVQRHAVVESLAGRVGQHDAEAGRVYSNGRAHPAQRG